MSHLIGFGWSRRPRCHCRSYRRPYRCRKLVFQPRPCSSMVGSLRFRVPRTAFASAGTVTLAECVPASDKCDGLFVIHRHATRRSLERLRPRSNRIRIAVRAFRVHVDQAHLHGGKRILEFSVTGVALVAKPRRPQSPNKYPLQVPRRPRARRRSRRS